MFGALFLLLVLARAKARDAPFSSVHTFQQALLDAVAEAACRGECQALIDTGVGTSGFSRG